MEIEITGSSGPAQKDLQQNVEQAEREISVGRSGLKMRIELLADVVAAIVECADEIRGKETRDSQDYGQLLAYAETLCIIRDACAGYDLSEIGLAFDIDARYL